MTTEAERPNFDSVYVTWMNDDEDQEDLSVASLDFGDPKLANFKCHFTEKDVVFLPLYVRPDLRRHKLATRLMSALVNLSLTNGLTQIGGAVESQHTFKILKNFFPEEAFTFSDIDPVKKRAVTLPMTMPQAIASLERAEKFEEDAERRIHGLIIEVDISGAQADCFEKPIVRRNMPGS